MISRAVKRTERRGGRGLENGGFSGAVGAPTVRRGALLRAARRFSRGFNTTSTVSLCFCVVSFVVAAKIFG